MGEDFRRINRFGNKQKYRSTSNNKGQMHILGLCIDSQQKEFNKILQNIKKERVDRNNKLIEELNKMGFDITIEELKEVSNGNVIGKPHFAKVFIKKGVFPEN